MMRQTIAVFLVALIMVPVPGWASGPAQEVKTVQEQVLAIPSGSLVEVRLANKQKLRGRMGEAAEDGFTIRLVKGDRLEDHKVFFVEVKSIKDKTPGTGKGTHILAGVGVAFLVLMGLNLIIYAAYGGL